VAGRAAIAGLLEPMDCAVASEPLPAWLLEHQADAVLRARAILRRFGGALVADAVGLGKTYIGLALAALERADGGDAIAIVPAALRVEWQRACEAVGVPLRIVSHTQLAARALQLPARCSLLLVDEAHAFRNPATRRYDALARLAIGRRVALLTATPLNNTPSDLASLIHLFAPRDRFREFGVRDLAADLAAGRRATQLALGALSVCRTRRLVERRFPELAGAFPRRTLLPPVRYDLNRAYAGHLDALLDALALPAHGAGRGAALLAVSLVRRLESSGYALRRSLIRQRAFLEEWRRADDAGIALTRRAFARAVPRGEDNDTQLVMWPVLAAEGAGDPHSGAAWRHTIDRALVLLDDLPSVDPKLEALQRLLDGPARGRKTIVFTEYRDTALYLLRELRRRRRVIAVAGDAAWAGVTRLQRTEALDAFAPAARGRPRPSLLDADVLIATDVASEGLNLQDAGAVVNYDLPWNPVKVMQRVGRIDRLHSPHPDVLVGHIVAGGGLSSVCGVLEALREKIAMGSHAPGAEPDPLAALWWLDEGSPEPEAVERESWRRVAAFEAREHWRMLLGPCIAPQRDGPLVAAGVVADGAAPAAGLLLAVQWPDGRRVPLPFAAFRGRPVSRDPLALAALAERALTARQAPAEPAQFAQLIAEALPDARRALTELSAARHSGGPSAPGRRAALARLMLHAADLRRSRANVSRLDEAIRALSADLTAGLERLINRIGDTGSPEELARRVIELVAAANIARGPDLAGLPRIVLVAAIALAVED